MAQAETAGYAQVGQDFRCGQHQGLLLAFPGGRHRVAADLHHTLTAGGVRRAHGLAQLLQPGPGGLVTGGVEQALQLLGAGVESGAAEPPDGQQPVPKGPLDAVHEGAGGEGVAVAADWTGQIPLGREVRMAGAAEGAEKTVRPAQGKQVADAGLLGGEPPVKGRKQRLLCVFSALVHERWPRLSGEPIRFAAHFCTGGARFTAGFRDTRSTSCFFFIFR